MFDLLQGPNFNEDTLLPSLVTKPPRLAQVVDFILHLTRFRTY